nr:LysM peptidoglycan-binding domain-containing protein [Chloroflexota bacterium]
VVFFLPGFLAGGDSTERPRGTGPGESPSTAVETATPRPTPTPAPTPQVHIVASGDTLGGIARQNGLTIEELLAANPQITDPDRISIGDEIIIPDDPVTPSDDVPDEDATDQVGRTERPSGGDPPQETAEP